MSDVTNPESEVTEVVETEDNFEAFEQLAESDDDSEQQEEAATELDEDGNPSEEPAEDSEDSEPADEDEIEIDGKKYRVPKDAALRQADYTRKTQELAEQRKAVEAALERLDGASKAEIDAQVRVNMIDAQLAQFQDIDWQQWDQINPVEANRARWEYTELQRQRNDAVVMQAAARQQAQSIAQQETARRLEQGAKVLAEKIPGWGADKANAILDFGVKTYGFDPEELRSIDNPLAILVLHDAMEGRKARAQAETRKKIEKQQAIKPAAVLKGNAGRVAISPSTTDFAAFEKLASKSR